MILQLCALVLLAPVTAQGGGARAAAVGPGRVTLLYPSNPAITSVAVERFWLDRYPVTNRDFLTFVRANAKWRRASVPRLFAGESYLAHWAADLTLGAKALPRAPVTHVSWFAARAYCEERGGRLPRELEWELAAQASETLVDASTDPAFRQRILDWYARPSSEVLPAVGRGKPNAWGLHDLHGVVWEWVDDFAASLVNDDGRGGGDTDRARFCGAGALNAKDTQNYASFMRVAMRSSLEANYTLATLGFRCAYDKAG